MKDTRPSEVFQKLREKLDQYSCGFPLTESGVEFKILERIFTEEEAEMFLGLNLNSKQRKKLPGAREPRSDMVAPLLQRMKEKGNLFSWHRGDTVKYGAVPFVLGLYEFQLNRMDRELAGLCEQYFKEAFFKSIASVDPLMRAIPINVLWKCLIPSPLTKIPGRLSKTRKSYPWPGVSAGFNKGLLIRGAANRWRSVYHSGHRPSIILIKVWDSE